MEVHAQLHALVASPCEKVRSTYHTGGWVSTKANLDILDKRKITCPYQESNPDSFIFQPTT
jgi:hypothetical protein